MTATMPSAMRTLWCGFLVLACLLAGPAAGQTVEQVADIPTRPGVSVRALVITPSKPKAVAVLLAGGDGGLRLQNDGSMRWGRGNFLVRSRQLFVEAGLRVLILDAPSDRLTPPYLQGFRQSAEHVADLAAVIAWERTRHDLPVWLVGTSRGTESAAYAATELAGAGGPDGLVLSSTIVAEKRGRPVPAMPLQRIRVPVLVVHHEQDACARCPFEAVPWLMRGLSGSAAAELIAMRGGDSVGDACGAFAHHGFNGLEAPVVSAIARWVFAAPRGAR